MFIDFRSKSNISLMAAASCLIVTFCVGQSFAASPTVKNQPGGLKDQLFHFLSIPQKTKIEINDEGQVILKGSDINEKQALLNELSEQLNLTIRVPSDFSIQTNINITDPIQKLLPRIPLQTRYLMDGVNCHNTSLLAANVLDAPSHVDELELDYILNKHCRSITAPIPGAIGVLKRGTMLSHSFYVVTNHIAFQKRSLDSKTDYNFQVVKNYPPAEYFVCHTQTWQCQDQQLIQLKNQMKYHEKYFLRLTENLQDFHNRDSHLTAIREQITKMEKLKFSGRCELERQNIFYRLRSLETLAYALSGMGGVYSQRDFSFKD